MATDSPSADRLTPRCFISYTHDSAEHRAHVARLAQALRGFGINTVIDQYIEHEPPLSWPQWMTEQIENATHVLVVAPEPYFLRFTGRESPAIGKGVRWEGAIITGELYEAEDDRVKFIPIVLRSEDVRFIPNPIRLTTRHRIATLSDDELRPLVNQIKGIAGLVPTRLAEAGGSAGLSPRVPGSPAEAADLADPVADAVAILRETAAQGEADTTPLERLIGGSDSQVSARAAFELGNFYYSEMQFSRAVTAFQRVVDYGPRSPVFEAAASALQSVLFEMDSHLGEGGPVKAVREWIEAVKAGDIDASWRQITPETRLVLAQAWIFTNQSHPTLAGLNREELAKELSRPSSEHFVFPHFMTSQIGEFQQAYQAFDSQDWGAAERPRRYKTDYELVILMDTGGDLLEWNQGISNPSLIVVLRRVNTQWWVAGFSPEIPKPGWPPTYETFPLADGTRFIPKSDL